MEGGESMTEYIYALLELEYFLLKGKQELEEINQFLENEILVAKKYCDKK